MNIASKRLRGPTSALLAALTVMAFATTSCSSSATSGPPAFLQGGTPRSATTTAAQATTTTADKTRGSAAGTSVAIIGAVEQGDTAASHNYGEPAVADALVRIHAQRGGVMVSSDVQYPCGPITGWHVGRAPAAATTVCYGASQQDATSSHGIGFYIYLQQRPDGWWALGAIEDPGE